MATPSDNTPPGFQPYISDDTGKGMKELTIPALVTGTCLGLIFSASSLYLVLKVGMTVSASIPVAVLAITLFRGLSNAFGFRRATILENNIVQTAGSAGESIAFGVGVTMPAFLLLGFDMEPLRIMVVSVLGGLLGILAMIPLRRAFIVNMHGRPGQPGTLLYPEGTACAQVLISGEKVGTTGKTVFIGFGIAFVHKFLTEAMGLLAAAVSIPFSFINRAAVFTTEMASEMLGVGYIIGFRTSSIMMAGAILGYLVIIPTIYFIGESNTNYVAPAIKTINDKGVDIGLIKNMSIKELRNNYLLYIGAGCVAAAGIISMLKTLPMIVRSIKSGLAGMSGGGAVKAYRRTEDDLPMSFVLLGSLGLIVVLAAFLMTEVGVVSAVIGALLVVLFGFLFVTVSARLTGEIGSSSNPISGMTVATLMLTCLIFLALGMTSTTDRILALSIAAVVCIASSNGGTTAQSLKTGFLVGGTPRAMQWAILIGAIISALVIGVILLALNNAGTVYSQKVPDLTLTQVEMDRLKATVTHEGKTYKVFDPRTQEITIPDAKNNYTPREELAKIPEGHYFVDTTTRKIALLKDPAIMGKLQTRDDGTKVDRGIDAPKTQVMGIIINGVLKRELNWSMVAIGGLIAVLLELCGISALAFAVGVYVPIQYSAPIFIGGIIRFFVDRYLSATTRVDRKPEESDAEYAGRVEVETIKRTETSPGVLLASGYIAGGSLAGVCAAFLEFEAVEKIKKSIDLSGVMKGLPPLTIDLIVGGIFAVLVVLLLAVGIGKIFGAKPEESGKE